MGPRVRIRGAGTGVFAHRGLGAGGVMAPAGEGCGRRDCRSRRSRAIRTGLRDALEVVQAVPAVGPWPVLNPLAETGLDRVREDVSAPVVDLVFGDGLGLEALGEDVTESLSAPI